LASGARTQLDTGTAPPPADPSSPQFYVSTDGDDSNPGTIDRPWRTIQMAMTSATPGSTVNIRGGTYGERLTVKVSGAAGQYITFQPYGFSVPAGGCGGYTNVGCGGDQVILDYGFLRTVSDGIPFLRITGRSFIRIQGITFQNFTTLELNHIYNQGVRIDGSSSSIEFAYNKFLNNKDTGPHDGSSAFLHIRVWEPANNVRFYGNEIGNVVTNYSEALTALGSTQHDFIVENNWIHDTDAGAIDVQGGAHHYTIRANRLEYISMKRDGTFWYGTPNVPIYNDGGNTGVIERNYISDAGVGIEVLAEPGQPAAHDVTIRDNVVRRAGTGIVLGTWYSNADGSSVYNLNVFNNTFSGNYVGVVIRPMNSSTVAWRNNVIAGNGTNYLNNLGWDPGSTDYNLYWGNGTGPGVHNVIADPRFTNADAGGFTPQPGSPVIDAGDPNTPIETAGTADFRGLPRIVNGRIDIGAYEAR
jgi:Right handed beta helix region/Protein of unknown function (DUF1565)